MQLTYTRQHQRGIASPYVCLLALLLSTVALKASTPPQNDDPANAISLVYSEMCENAQLGNLSGATPTSGVPLQSCLPGAPYSDNDVWFVFTATNLNTTISIDQGFSDAIPAFEIFDTNDLSTPIGCSQATGPGAEFRNNSLTLNATYYVRVFNISTFVIEESNLGFSICLHELPTLEAFSPFGSSCISANQFPTFTGSGAWKFFEIPDFGSGVVIAIRDSEALTFNSLGLYSNINNTAASSPHGPIMDRYWGVGVVQQPTAPVRIRFFLNNAEWQRFVSNYESLENHYLALHHFINSSCVTAYPENGTPDYLLPIQHVRIANNMHYVEYEIAHFSSFFIGQGPVSLPVTYQKITGRAIASGNLLEWTTSQEQDADFFAIERYNNYSWQTIGQVTATGNSSTSKSYQFTDHLPPHKTAVYRIKQYDLDGSYHYSSLINISRKTDSSVKVYPNPAKDVLQFSHHDAVIRLEIFTLSGQKIRSTNQLEDLDISSLSPGIYMLNIQLNDGSQQLQKITKL